MAKIRKGDTVQVITGKDKGLTGTVLVVYPDRDRVLVEGVNRVKKHTRAAHSSKRAAATTSCSPRPSVKVARSALS